jgi:hypothetical protein
LNLKSRVKALSLSGSVLEVKPLRMYFSGGRQRTCFDVKLADGQEVRASHSGRRMGLIELEEEVDHFDFDYRRSAPPLFFHGYDSAASGGKPPYRDGHESD